jgi:YfiR/HmsC-like
MVLTVHAILGGPSDVDAQATVDEQALKAAVVAKLPDFVEWPAPVSSHQGPVVLCLTGPTSFRQQLQSLTTGTGRAGRPYVVRLVGAKERLDTCHLLFLHDLAASARLLARAAALPILTVSDDPGFLDRGGIILLRTVGRRLRFEVNVTAAQRAELRLSSQLLGLAMQVRREPS